MLRRAFFASAAAAVAALLGASAGPKKVRIIERLESGRWVPRWLAEVKSGDRFRFIARRSDREYVLEGDPVRTGERSYDVNAKLVAGSEVNPGDYEPCSSN